MRLSRSCKLLKLIVFSTFFLVIYCLQTRNVFTFTSHAQNGFEVQNISHETNSSASRIVDTLVKANFPSVTNATLSSVAIIQEQFYNIWCIFTKVTTNSPMHRKFRIFVNSLLKFSSVNISFHIISEEGSQAIAEKVIQLAILKSKKHMRVQFHNVHKIVSQLEDIVSVMSPHFSSKPGSYYSDALFFLSLGLHRIAPIEQDLAIMFDADVKFKKDVKELFKEFNNFGKESLFGLVPELTPVYRHILYIYRNKNPETEFGEADYLGGYPGYNSGVILFNLKRLRESLEYDQIVSRDSVEHMTKKYYFKGHLGDQDFYTLLGMERPELVHKVECGWNRQLCTWWRDRGYTGVFANYSHCDSETKLWHGNCNTPIPDD